MDFDTFVNRPQRVNDKILHQLQEAERLQSICNSATAIYSDIRVQTSRENQREKWLVRLIDSKKKLSDLMDEYDKVTAEVRDWLQDNLSADNASLLEFRYVDGLKIREIADLLHYAEQTTKNKISKANQEARKIFDQQKGEI